MTTPDSSPNDSPIDAPSNRGAELTADTWPVQRTPLPPPPELPWPEAGLDWQALHCRPVIDPTAWVAPGAVVMGRVRLGARSSVWYGSILRGDGEWIEVGEESNVQDGAILHIDPGYPCILGRGVTLGHRAVVHASRVGDGCLVGIGATVLSRCEIGAGALIAAGAVVLEGTQVPAGTLWAGCPARQIRELTPEQQARLRRNSQHYANSAAAWLARFGRSHIDALTAEQAP